MVRTLEPVQPVIVSSEVIVYVMVEVGCEITESPVIIFSVEVGDHVYCHCEVEHVMMLESPGQMLFGTEFVVNAGNGCMVTRTVSVAEQPSMSVAVIVNVVDVVRYTSGSAIVGENIPAFGAQL